MALKDLIAQKSTLNEESIEQAVGAYVRYDPDERDIVFTPEFSKLSNKAKILVYLVAILGWPFVLDEQVATETKPSDLSEKLGIPGGSLRPTLKELKDRHFVFSKGEGYSVRISNLNAIRRELEAAAGSAVSVRKRRAIKRGKSASPPLGKLNDVSNGDLTQNDGLPTEREQRKRKSASGGDLAQTFKGWITEGFFDKPKTLAQVQARFHEEAILIPRTSIPKYLLAGVREKALSRAKQDVNGKQLWAYQTKTKG